MKKLLPPKILRARFPFLFLVGGFALAPVAAQAAGLTAGDGATEELFGFSVSLSGGTGVAGAFGDTIGSNVGQGSAYVYRNLGTTAAPR